MECRWSNSSDDVVKDGRDIPDKRKEDLMRIVAIIASFLPTILIGVLEMI